MKFQIENYDSMTPEEKVAALEAYEPDMSGFVSKSTFDKAASEVASYKKQLREKMTEDEMKKAQEAEERAKLLARVEELEKEKTVNGYLNTYLTMGYDEKLARASAEAMANGDMNTVFENQKKHAEIREKALRTELLQQTPQPPSGEPDKGMTLEKFRSMTLAEKARFAQENPEIYKDIYGGN